MIVGGLLGDDSKGEADGLEKRVDGWMDGWDRTGRRKDGSGSGRGRGHLHLPTLWVRLAMPRVVGSGVVDRERVCRCFDAIDHGDCADE